MLAVMTCQQLSGKGLWAPLSHLKVLMSSCWAQGFHVALHCGVPSVEVLVQCVTTPAAHGVGSVLLLLSVLLPWCWLPGTWSWCLLTFEEPNMNTPCPRFDFDHILNLPPVWFSSGFIATSLTNVRHKPEISSWGSDMHRTLAGPHVCPGEGSTWRQPYVKGLLILKDTAVVSKVMSESTKHTLSLLFRLFFWMRRAAEQAWNMCFPTRILVSVGTSSCESCSGKVSLRNGWQPMRLI